MRRFTLTELLVVVVIILILVSLLATAIMRSREKAVQAVCISNQGQIARACTMYLMANRNYYPTRIAGTQYGWFGKTAPYIPADNPRPLNVYLKQNNADPLLTAKCPADRYTRLNGAAKSCHDHTGASYATNIPGNQYNNTSDGPFNLCQNGSNLGINNNLVKSPNLMIAFIETAGLDVVFHRWEHTKTEIKKGNHHYGLDPQNRFIAGFTDGHAGLVSLVIPVKDVTEVDNSSRAGFGEIAEGASYSDATQDEGVNLSRGMPYTFDRRYVP
ncbi:MAG: hypothetical protein RL095_1834 [Verrucomicrobiota bacterium]|jgi:type II secretory pathway pseudopilin PulG